MLILHVTSSWQASYDWALANKRFLKCTLYQREIANTFIAVKLKKMKEAGYWIYQFWNQKFRDPTNIKCKYISRVARKQSRQPKSLKKKHCTNFLNPILTIPHFLCHTRYVFAIYYVVSLLPDENVDLLWIE